MAAGRRTLTVFVVMGVSGSGKSTIGRMLASRLGCPFVDADELHPPANVTKMAAGTPLTDADRAPWLALVAQRIDSLGSDGVVACSALRVGYRDVLRRPSVLFVYLAGPRTLLLERLRERHGHFMPASLLDSQLASLEPPGPDERAITVDVDQPPDAQVADILAVLR